jgi:SAM-dependent methyltransferase
MENKEKELNQISNRLIELREYDLAKGFLDGLVTDNKELNDEKLYKLSLLESQINSPESAHKFIFKNKDNFTNSAYFHSALEKTGFHYYCPVKRIRVNRLYPLPSMYSDKLKEHNSDLRIEDFETINIEGYHCRESGSNDRDRLYAMFLDKLMAETPIGAKLKILDFSPSKPFEDYMRWNKTFDYVTADGLLDTYDIVVDVQNMVNLDANTFDGVICSHVLEHVPDDVEAMREIYRVLKPGGWAILMAPINLTRAEIDEDFTVEDIAERWRRFGQDDHLRVYSKKGYMGRVQESGFKLLELGKDYFGEFELHRCGITQKSILYLGLK